MIYLKTRNPVFLNVYQYWIKIFALVFGLGVVSGLVMSYQFGTNWSVFSDKTGPIIGLLMGYEVLSAFFLKAGFLGIMLFGIRRVGPRLHFFATLMVAVGTLMSAFWMLSVNSWMHTPAGYSINAAGQFVPKDWWQVVFNPSFPYRFSHMVVAAYLTTAFVVGAVGAYHLLRNKENIHARLMFSMSMWMALLISPVQAVIGDLHGLNTLEHQPMKIAALEGHFETQRGAPFIVIGFPDRESADARSVLEIPKIGSLILTHDIDGEIKGLKEWPRQDWPPAAIVFWSFRIMLGIALLLIMVGMISGWLRYKKQLYDNVPFLKFCLLMGPSGFVAVLSGWITTEVGRQPYTVYGLLRTSDTLSPVAVEGVAGSLLGFFVVYIIVFGAGLLYLMRMMQKPPVAAESGLPTGEPLRASGITPAASIAPNRILEKK